jgi:lipopolysaccharide/colanic/teichoic acid biosynthesis glycosyltransferase
MDADRQTHGPGAVAWDVGRLHIVAGPVAPAVQAGSRRSAFRVGFDAVCALLLLVVSAPVLAAAALAVRLSSHGPVLHREATLDRRGRPTHALSFRTVLDGGATRAHQQLRSVVGAADRAPLTGVGRFLVATRLDRLPRLLNVAAGRLPLF